MVLEQMYIHLENINLDLYLTHTHTHAHKHTHKQLEMDHKPKGTTLKLLIENNTRSCNKQRFVMTHSHKT